MKKRIILIIILLSIFMIGAVSASSDTNTTTDSKLNKKLTQKDTHTPKTNNNNIKTDTYLTKKQTKDTLKNTDNGTFTSLQNKINTAPEGSTIKLENNYNYDTGFNIDGIKISKSITIDGNGKTINGNQKARAFHITSNVILKNIILINCITKITLSSRDKGGAIYYSGGNNSIINSTFQNCYSTSNSSSTSYGGAIYYSGGINSIINSTFNNCYCTSNYSESSGGAIYYSGGNNSIINSTFNNCHSTSTYSDSIGGAIHSSIGNTSISSCKFNNCYTISIYNHNENYKSHSYGGAISYSSGNNSIIKSKFTNCSTTSKSSIYSYGGGIYCLVGNNSLINCTFTNCSTTSKSSSSTQGSAIHCEGGSSNIINCIETKNSNIFLSSKNINAKETAIINYNLTSGTQGILSVYLNNKFTKNVTVGSPIKIENLKGGSYTVKVIYNGDDYYTGCENTTKFNVIKLNSKINFNVNNCKWGDNLTINPTITKGATGNLDIYINNKYNSKIKIGDSLKLKSLNRGNNNGQYTITIKYNGDDYFKDTNTTKTFTVNGLNSTCKITGQLEPNNSAKITITLNKDATGTIQIFNQTKNLNKGTATFNTPKLSSGTYLVKINYTGDSKYNPFTKNQKLKINPKKSNIKINIKNVKYKTAVKISPQLTNKATGKINIYIISSQGNNLPKTIIQKTIKVGETYSFTPNIGIYTVKVKYTGDKYHQSSENKTSFAVFKHNPIVADNTAIIHGSGKYFQATFYDEQGKPLVNKAVTFSINKGPESIFYTNKKGIAQYKIKLPINNYTITTINNAIPNEKRSFKLKVFTSIQTKNMTRTKNTGQDFYAKLFNKNSEPLINYYIKFKVNKKIYSVLTNENGIATLNKHLKPGKYTITTYNDITNENKTNTLKIIPSINAQDMTRPYNSTYDFQAKFLNKNTQPLKNKQIIFKVYSHKNKKTTQYTLQTNNNGIATLKQKNNRLNIGNYTITIINTITKEQTNKKLNIISSQKNNKKKNNKS